MKTDLRLFKPILLVDGNEIRIPSMVSLIGMETAQVVIMQSEPEFKVGCRHAVVCRKFNVVKWN